jgi:hypothetical protein
LNDGFAEFARWISQAQRTVAAVAASPGMAEFARSVSQAQRTVAAVAASPGMAEFAKIAAHLATSATAAIPVTIPTQSEFETYDFSVILDPAIRPYLLTMVFILTFAASFAFVVDNYELSATTGTLTGISTLWVAERATQLAALMLRKIAGEA